VNSVVSTESLRGVWCIEGMADRSEHDIVAGAVTQIVTVMRMSVLHPSSNAYVMTVVEASVHDMHRELTWTCRYSTNDEHVQS